MGTPVKRYIVTPDKHVPYHDPPAWNCMLHAIRIIKPDGYVDLGDFLENEGASHWQWKKKKRPPLEYQLEAINRELVEANKFLDEIDEALDKAGTKIKHFLVGNHDEWLDRLVEENPFLSTTEHPTGKGYGFKDAMQLRRRGYKVTECGDVLKIGKLYFHHGHHYGGIHHAKNHLLKMGVNVMYGHWHDIQEHSITHVDGQKAAWSIGCLKSLEPEKGNQWLGRRNTNWAHAFAVVDFWNGQHFTVHIVRIIDGKCSLWGELIDGNKEKAN